MQIDGTSEQIEAARQLVEEVTSEVCSMVVVYMFLRDLVMFMQKMHLYSSICWSLYCLPVYV